jgi:hypothetical protein
VDTATQPSHLSLSRQSWIDRFQLVASQSELTDDLVSLVELLNLPLSCSLAVHQVLREGNWAKAEHPRVYVKKATLTQARKMHLAIPHTDDTLECECVGGPLVFMGGATMNERWDGCKLARVYEDEDGEAEDGPPPFLPIMPLKGKHYVAAQFAPDEEVLWREQGAAESRPSWPRACWTKLQIPKWLLSAKKAQYGDDSDEFLAWKFSQRRRDWEKLGKKAGLDPWECKVLEYRSRKVSRDRAMSEQPDTASRLSIQSAWKQMDRTGLKKVQDFLKKNRSQDVPDEQFQNTKKTGAGPSESRRALRAAFERTGKSRMDLGRVLFSYRAAFGVTDAPNPVFIRSSSEK